MKNKIQNKLDTLLTFAPFIFQHMESQRDSVILLLLACYSALLVALTSNSNSLRWLHFLCCFLCFHKKFLLTRYIYDYKSDTVLCICINHYLMSDGPLEIEITSDAEKFCLFTSFISRSVYIQYF